MYATLLATEMAGMPPGTNLYRLDEPLEGFGHVTVTATELFGQALVSIVGCTETGYVEAPSVESLWRSDLFMTHADALAAVGYQEATP